MRTMTLAEVGVGVGTATLDALTASRIVTRVTTDSRQVRHGDLFWAIAGERFDGHDFVRQALAAGAAGAVVRRDFVGDEPLLRVADTRAALGQFAAWHRRLWRTKVIGVTGSVGKTSTREAIFAVLASRFAGIRSDRNFNNDIGVPLSLFEVGPEHNFAVIEMGASAAGEIAQLAQIAKPDFGVLTAIGAAHLEGFGSIDGVARAKAELIESLGPKAVAVLNANDERVRAIGERANCRVAWYSVRTESHDTACSPHPNPLPKGEGTRVVAHDIETHGETVSFRWDGGKRVTLRAPGRHQVQAALAAVAIGRLWGMKDDEIAAGLDAYRPASKRCEVEHLDWWRGTRPGGIVTVINDAYNACPPSMAAALELLETWPTAGRRVLVCGDMKELGADSAEFHRQLGESIASRRGIHACVAIGPLTAEVADAARRAGMEANRIVHFDSTETAAGWLNRFLASDDVVLVKASRAMQLERVIEQLRDGAERRRVA